MKTLVKFGASICMSQLMWITPVWAQGSVVGPALQVAAAPTAAGTESTDSEANAESEKAQADASRVATADSFPDEPESDTDDDLEQAKELAPSRSNRMIAVMGSLGWNSLAGFGIGATLNFGPYVAADIAVGLAAIGLKSGARVRYNLVKGNWTPALGLGFQFGPGSGGRAILVDGQGGTAELVIEPSGYVQGIVAMSYQGGSGFTALFGAGYAVLMDNDNVRLVSGSEATADVTRFVAQNGAVLEAALGYAF